jgi:hypothetical protein
MPVSNKGETFGVSASASIFPPLPLDNTERAEAGDFGGDACGVQHADDLGHVLVGFGLFLFEAGFTTGTGDHAPIKQFALDGSTLARADGRPARHAAARTVAAASEGVGHGPLAPDEDVAGPAHVAGYEHGLADTAVAVGQFGVARRKGAGGPLAMHAQLYAFTLHVVGFHLRDVVSHVVHQVHAESFGLGLEDFGEGLAREVGHDLPVAPGEIGGGAHRTEVLRTLG